MGRNTPTKIRSNILGDTRAENDRALMGSFYESPDYRALLESADRTLVVGRRGTGKSATFLRLAEHWKSEKATQVVALAPDDTEMLPLRAMFGAFASRYSLVRAVSKVSWRYGILISIADVLSKHYRFEKSGSAERLRSHLKHWNIYGGRLASRLSRRLGPVLNSKDSPEIQIGDLANVLGLEDLHHDVAEALASTRTSCVVLADRLDEGYEPDDLGVGIVAGLVHAAIELNSSLAGARFLVFLRDNIARALSRLDPDFSRSIEGQILRLHWDERSLFNFVCNRFRSAFDLKMENNSKIWNAKTSRELAGVGGFQRCLRHTLYRPRDLLVLLNEAFLSAQKDGRDVVVDGDIESTARMISDHRLRDLVKEYEAIFPGLELLVRSFAGSSPDWTVEDAAKVVSQVLRKEGLPAVVRSHIEIIGDEFSVVRELFAVGFLGVRDDVMGHYVFSHDGKAPTISLDVGARVLVHPCYWMALNLTHKDLSQQQADVIHDEYDIEVASMNPTMRVQKLSQLVSELGAIGLGEDDSEVFADWCMRAMRVVFAGSLRNLRVDRNDRVYRVSGSNVPEAAFWERTQKEYGCVTPVFVIRNDDVAMTEVDLAQIVEANNGRSKVMFLVNRSRNHNLGGADDGLSGELSLIRELYAKRGILVMRLTASMFEKMLHKLRSPPKHDEVDRHMNSLLDQYVKVWLRIKPR